MEKLAGRFERAAVIALMLLLMATIFFGTVVVAWSLVDDLVHTRDLVAEPKVLFEIFGLFVAVLVGVELLKILRHLLVAHEVDTVLIVQTALMALCNKIITLNVKDTDWTVFAGLAAVILSLAAAIHALRDPARSRP